MEILIVPIFAGLLLIAGLFVHIGYALGRIFVPLHKRSKTDHAWQSQAAGLYVLSACTFAVSAFLGVATALSAAMTAVCLVGGIIMFIKAEKSSRRPYSQDIRDILNRQK